MFGLPSCLNFCGTSPDSYGEVSNNNSDQATTPSCLHSVCDYYNTREGNENIKGFATMFCAALPFAICCSAACVPPAYANSVLLTGCALEGAEMTIAGFCLCYDDPNCSGHAYPDTHTAVPEKK